MKDDLIDLRILLVDDNIINLKLISKLLAKWGIQADMAENGQQAVDLTRARVNTPMAYQVILMDIHMPIMDGPTAGRLIQAIDPSVIILAMSADVMPDDALRAGSFTGFLLKPFTPDSLRTTLLSFLT